MVNGMAAAPCAAVISVNSCYKYRIWEGPYKLMTNFRVWVIDYKNKESETRYIISKNLEISCGRQKDLDRKMAPWKCTCISWHHINIFVYFEALVNIWFLFLVPLNIRFCLNITGTLCKIDVAPIVYILGVTGNSFAVTHWCYSHGLSA